MLNHKNVDFFLVFPRGVILFAEEDAEGKNSREGEWPWRAARGARRGARSRKRGAVSRTESCIITMQICLAFAICTRSRLIFAPCVSRVDNNHDLPGKRHRSTIYLNVTPGVRVCAECASEWTFCRPVGPYPRRVSHSLHFYGRVKVAPPDRFLYRRDFYKRHFEQCGAVGS